MTQLRVLAQRPTGEYGIRQKASRSLQLLFDTNLATLEAGKTQTLTSNGNSGGHDGAKASQPEFS